ncbi:MAG: DUF2723 domain-containing protein [Bacteroidetes bacterium]|nr:MAG: DUF2723 domain-containing protein [Bacteroidota bacterium]
MNWKLTERLVAAAVFVYALVLYVLTVAPTASFWDSGEFIASVYGLEVMHPPGAPFYMLVGRFFSMFVPPPYVALAVNLISVLASALTVLLTHLIIVQLVQAWQDEAEARSTGGRLTALAGGVIGALTFAATDSFWFNAVEAEVYALSMFFTAIVVWLIMRWSIHAREEEARLIGGRHPFSLAANRYLILIAYLFGLAIGVHLLNLLAIFFIALIIFYTEFERPNWTNRQRFWGLVLTGVGAVIAFLLIYPGIIQWLPTLAGNSGAPFLFFLAVIALVTFGVWYTQRQGMQAANLVMLCITMVLVGYSTYALIFIRSAADPPIDLNDPETPEAFVSFLKREQYGQTPLLKGYTYDDQTGRIDERREVFFPRRWSPDPNHLRVYRQYTSDWDFFLGYQVGHMYVRYFLWNFAGRSSDLQDAPAITGIRFLDPEVDLLLQTPSEQASRNVYYALPLLLGLIGAAFHFIRDWRRAFAVFILFFVTGIGIVLYLNQPPLQPRERDYSYVASFFAFSLWVGIGAAGILQLVRDALPDRMASAARNGVLLALAGVLLLAVPVWMMAENYFDHDRSGRYVAPEYAYNMLMSLEENAILFTNGDNDTYPLWYLQAVENVRPDVRVVNLSLLNTPWYIKQLRDQWAHESAPLPISLSDDQIDNLAPQAWQPREVSLPVEQPEVLAENEVFVPRSDTARIQSPMTWTLRGRPLNSEVNALYVADLAVYDILRTNARQGWTRPIYFAVTVSSDGQLDLQDYFQLEGQAFRVVPIRHNESMGRIVPGVSDARLDRFKFTNLANPDVYFDENIRRLLDNYRRIYARTAQGLIDQGHTARAATLLDTLMAQMPLRTIPADESTLLPLAMAYQTLGDQDQVLALMQAMEPVVLHRFTAARSQRELEYASQVIQFIRATYLEAGAYEQAAAFSDRLADALGDDSLRQSAEDLRRQYEQALPPAAGDTTRP